MGLRFDGRKILINNDKLYRPLFKERGIKMIRQYDTPVLRYPTVEQIQELETIGYVFGHGDRFWKLADKYYGDPSLWWVIAFYNRKPTESHVAVGDVVQIPFPLEKILKFMGI